MPESMPKIEPHGLRYYLLLVWKWVWLFILLAVLAAGVTFAASRLITPVYQAKTILLINDTPTTGVNDYTAILMSERQASTYAEMINNPLLLKQVMADLGLNTNEKSLAESIRVDLIPNTRLISITVDNINPTLAANIANDIAIQFINQLQGVESSTYAASQANLEKQMKNMDQQIQDTSAALAALGADNVSAEADSLKTTLAEYRQTYANLELEYEAVQVAEASANSGIIHLQPATPPQSPISPQIMLNTALAALAGLALAGCAVFFIEALDDKIHTPEDVKQYLGLPIYGVIPSHSIEIGKPVTISQPRSPVSNAFRTLRANIHYASVDQPLKKLLITSSMPGEGKSTIVANLGVVMAQSNLQTIIIDTDFYHPTVHASLGLDNKLGLSDLLANKHLDLNENIQKADPLNVELLSTGHLPPNPTELLGSKKMLRILQLLSEQADIILIDTSPVMVVADSVVIASRVDGVLIVIKPGVTRITAAKQSIEQLQNAKANILGVILNDVNIKRDGYYGYYYSSYHNNYGEDKPKRRSPIEWIKGRKA